MVRTRRAAAAYLTVLAISAATPAIAGVGAATFRVSAKVVAHAWIEPIDEPASILLTSANLEQGYRVLEVRYRVHTSGTSRYLINIAPNVGLAQSIHIEGLGAPVSLGQTDITVLQQAPASVNDLRLRMRLELRPGLVTGRYSMPVRMSVSVS